MDIRMTKRAFTLVELLVVMGIMAALATISIGSYFAVVRGMADRGALAAATSVISLALERARIDMQPTVVYFYNELVQNKDSSKGTDLVVAGVAVAVRRAGRISRVNGDLIHDEFADLERTYDLADNPNSLQSDTFRLYRFNFSRMQYSSVYSEVVEDEIGNEKYLVEQPVDRGFIKPGGDESKKKDTESADKMLSYAFKVKSGFSSWRAGDTYGYEFARIRLPDNYLFGSDMPTATDPIKELPSYTRRCYPDSDAESLETVPIYGRRPNGWKMIGDTKREMKDI
jgi:prepilin-type N-terminal cleavage/methylation domain-containing protein